MNRKEFRELAEEIDKLKDSGHEFDGLERVEAKVADNVGAVVILEMDHTDLARISTAAREAGENVNDFMRIAALARVEELKPKRKKASA